MYICEDCGKIYEDEEAVSVEEMPYGEEHCGLGKPIWDNNRVEVETCSCGGELVKAKKCEKCGEWMPDNIYHICSDCRDKYATLDAMIEMGAEWQNKFALNGFLTSIFSAKEIELILIDVLKRRDDEFVNAQIKEFCDFDIECFWGYADRKWKEGK